MSLFIDIITLFEIWLVDTRGQFLLDTCLHVFVRS